MNEKPYENPKNPIKRMTLQHPLKNKPTTDFINSVTKEMNTPREFHFQRVSNDPEKPERLFKLLSNAPQVRQTKKEYYDSLLCLYDGIKLRSYDRDYIDWLINQEQFNFKITVDTATGMILRYQGEYRYDRENPKNKKKFDIDIHLVPQYPGWAVDFSGSVHNWSNKGHNHNDFFWKDFLKVYHEMITVFQFDPENLEIVNLEVGVNCVIPDWMKVTIPEILESILSLLGVCKNKSWIQKSNRDSFKVERGERYLKAYYKSVQYKLGKEVIRLELGYPRSRRLIKDSGVKMFSDLIKISSLFKFKQLLDDAFKDLHTNQPGLSTMAAKELEADPEIAKYNTASFWCKLKKENRRKYLKAREKQERLINKYCSYNLSKDIKRMLHEKLR
ncbi:MAG: hypothetical protein JWQ09_401 [Segetibacter sp.]|nr:hypothetical protein [Segetibacter sp.]